MSSIRTTAPGKLVLTGEYAVLVGAPALVLAVDRRVSCSIRQVDGSGWRFESTGFLATATHHRDNLLHTKLDKADPARICQCVLKAFGDRGLNIERLPEGLAIDLDSREFFQNGSKLGLGSSAALTVAVTQALASLSGDARNVLDIALHAHRSLQGGRGSGLDVATAFLGGLIEFRRDPDTDQVTTAPRALPAGVELGFFWTGRSSSTVDHLGRFARWTDTGPKTELRDLQSAALAVIESLPAADRFMRQLRAYSDRLRALDEVSGIGIYGPTHAALAEAAATGGAIYKPSGAGGGDVGIAVAESAEAIDAFARVASEMGVTSLQLSMEQHGIEVSRE